MIRSMFLVLAAWLAASPVLAAPAPCDRACLYKVLDRYLLALKAHDPAKAPFAPNARTSENNVMLAPGDGLWGTITGLAVTDDAVIDRGDRNDLGRSAGEEDLIGEVELGTSRELFANLVTEVASDRHDRVLGDPLERRDR